MNPSIPSSTALIATMNTGAWRATKLHKDETAKVNTQHHADDVARVSVTITAHSALEGINKLHAKARQDHYRITLPCGDEGWRFLPCGREMEHSDMMLAYRSEHDKLVNDEGVDPRSDEYYTRINNRIREVFPDKFADSPSEKPKRSNVVAPATRSTAPKKIVLTPSAVSIAKRLGIPLDLYARKVAEEMRNTNG